MKCKLCQSEKLELIEVEQKYYYCQDCELIFLENEAIISPQKEKARYEEHNNSFQNKGYVSMFRDFIDSVLVPYLSLSSKQILDFGCGSAPVLAKLMTAKDNQVDYYDPYFYSDKFFIKKSYDLITATEVLEHLSNPYRELELLTSLLNQGGYLAVMTSFHSGPEEFVDWWYKSDLTHITFYNLNTFKMIASIFDLKIIYTDQKKYILFKI
ncbi:class I SAM-dependent methyltransferase [Halanaerobium salsuginis]|uniref:Methyltransferase domain-containing protein n=1 Tax=Halanaerobium salsuginis TaxID=29563 RepID=A0A1I4J709_9FIRM|nr:class I SAM-dependent methyltransferase [Halanaerobium salsuginis]SFL62334.1 Methyltransferase domain-containing protein [Halanaerobium salsuginis]